MDETGFQRFKLLATVKCGSCGCGCPTVLEADNGDLVIVGKLDSDIAAVEAVKQYIGEGETAVTIPRSLLLQAVKSLL